MTCRSAPTNGVVAEPVLLHLAGRKEVASVEDDRSAHQLAHAGEIRPAELVPFRHDGQRVGVLERVVVTAAIGRSEEHTSELQSQSNLVCRLLLEKKKK